MNRKNRHNPNKKKTLKNITHVISPCVRRDTVGPGVDDGGGGQVVVVEVGPAVVSGHQGVRSHRGGAEGRAGTRHAPLTINIEWLGKYLIK